MLKERVKAFLKDTGVSVTAFCRKTHISTSYYYKWLNDEVEFSSDICNRIGKYLDEVYAK